MAATVALAMAMIRYCVIDLSLDGRVVTLMDSDERLHIARGAVDGLLRGDVLQGRKAKLGAHLLLVDGQRTPLQVTFESVACSQDDALARMHPAPGR